MEIEAVIEWLKENVSNDNFKSMQQLGLDIAGSENYIFAIMADFATDITNERIALPRAR